MSKLYVENMKREPICNAEIPIEPEFPLMDIPWTLNCGKMLAHYNDHEAVITGEILTARITWKRESICGNLIHIGGIHGQILEFRCERNEGHAENLRHQKTLTSGVVITW